MNNRKLLIPMAAALLALAGCGPSGSSDSSVTDGASSSPDSSLQTSEESPSSSEETITDSPEESDSEQTSSSEVADSEESSSSDVTDSEEPVGPEKTIDQALLDEWAEASIDFAGTLTDTLYTTLTDIVGFIGKNTYSMLETDGEYVYVDTVVYREEGTNYAAYYSLLLDNTVETQYYVDGYAISDFDELVYNPFALLTEADLTETSEGVYSIASEKLSDFGYPLCPYVLENVSSITLERTDDVIALELISSYSDYGEIYNLNLSYELKISETTDLAVPTPYAHEDYHDAVGTALTAWDAALGGEGDETGYVLNKTLTPVDEPSLPVATSQTIVTSNAILIKNDGGITSDNDWGYAVYDDGEVYEFEIVDGAPVQGEALEAQLPLPLPGEIAPELFEETEEEGVYAFRDDSLALSAIIWLVEDPNLLSLIQYFGVADNLTITIEGGLVTGYAFDYMSMGIGSYYIEHCEVEIAEFDTATIDYEFVVPSAEPVDLSTLAGTWTGTMIATSDVYTIVIGEDGTATLNGEAATIEGEYDRWNNLVGTIVSDTYDLGFEYYPAYEEIWIYSDDYTVNVRLYKETGGVEDPVAIPEAMIGTWHAETVSTNIEGADGPVDLIIGEEEITLNGVVAELTDISESSGSVYATLTSGGLSYELTYNPAQGDWGAQISLSYGAETSDGYEYYNANLTLVEEGGGAIELDPQLVGTWVGIDTNTDEEHTLVINADGTGTFDGVTFDDPIEFTAFLLGYQATFTIGGVEYEISFLEASIGNPYMRVSNDDVNVDCYPAE
ncbi:MAG: hypothetical protein IAC61_05280 [Firmicutes bacterium]|uniref:Uncharacterized protein n=1 Tax=Candidatus Alloenteromonas pullistercoris TaxID=2840785 RepID=A0A9D9DHN0_9FIRM|nr:hypothetical protein [Candidatus Enteromonas pullistercoris]